MPDKAGPFGALLAASSLVAAILYVAGFAYRWSYYYNFGVQHIVYELGFQAVLMTAIELVRTPEHFLLFLFWIALPLVLVNALLSVVERGAQITHNALYRRVASAALRLLGLGSPLVVDAIRALVLIYATYMLSSHLGYTTFTKHVVDSPSNPLPAVTVIFDRKQGDTANVLSCGTQPKGMQLVGDAGKLRQIQETYRTCTGRGVTWRLLYRNNNVVVLFASEPEGSIKGVRPLTIVLPATSATQIVLQ